MCVCMYIFVGSSITIFIFSNNRFENYMKSKCITTHDSTCILCGNLEELKELILCNIELNTLDELSQE